MKILMLAIPFILSIQALALIGKHGCDKSMARLFMDY